MAIKKLCSKTGCHKIVDDGVKYCEVHRKKFELNEKERYKQYKSKRLKDEEQRKYQSFYNSDDWKRVRSSIISAYMGMDIVEYYTTGRVIAGERVHHIVELNEDWNSRLDVSNLIYLTEQNHRKIHAIYESSIKNKKIMQDKLFKMIDKFYKDFK